MAGPFETATKSALREILLGSLQESRFGYVLTEDGLDTLNEALFEFILVSRNLKAAGDRMLAQGLPPAQPNRGPTLKRPY